MTVRTPSRPLRNRGLGIRAIDASSLLDTIGKCTPALGITHDCLFPKRTLKIRADIRQDSGTGAFVGTPSTEKTIHSP